MTDDKLDGISRRLLRGVERLRNLELRKRAAPRSSDEFHRLAEEVETASANVFRVARDERQVGDEDSPAVAEQQEQEAADWSDGEIRPGQGRNSSPPV